MAKRKGSENLVSLADRTTEEQRRIASEGGKASGESRRQRKALKEYMELLLVCEPDKKTANQLLRLGINPEDITMALAVNMALVKKAMTGDVAAFKELRDLVGEAGDKVDENALAKARALLGGVDSAF